MLSLSYEYPPKGHLGRLGDTPETLCINCIVGHCCYLWYPSVVGLTFFSIASVMNGVEWAVTLICLIGRNNRKPRFECDRIGEVECYPV